MHATADCVPFRRRDEVRGALEGWDRDGMKRATGTAGCDDQAARGSPKDHAPSSSTPTMVETPGSSIVTP